MDELQHKGGGFPHESYQLQLKGVHFLMKQIKYRQGRDGIISSSIYSREALPHHMLDHPVGGT